MFPTHSGAGRSQERSRGYRAASHKNHISSIKLPSGMAKTGFGVVCGGKEHTFLSELKALLLIFQMPRLRRVLCLHAHVPRTAQASPCPVNARRSGTGQARWFHSHASTSPLCGSRDTVRGLIHKRGKDGNIPCAATVSQALCFGVPFTDKETEAGRWPALQWAWTLVVPSSLSESAL